MERGPVVFYLGSVSSSGGAKPGTQASPPSPPVLSVLLHAGKVSKKPSTPSLNCPLSWAQLETPLKLNPFPTQIPRCVHESQYLDAPSANLLHSSVQVLNFKVSRSWWCPPLEEKNEFLRRSRNFMAPLGAKGVLEMILSHRAPSSLNISSYRAIWTHFRPNSMILIQKYLVLAPVPGPGPEPGPGP